MTHDDSFILAVRNFLNDRLQVLHNTFTPWRLQVSWMVDLLRDVRLERDEYCPLREGRGGEKDADEQHILGNTNTKPMKEYHWRSGLRALGSADEISMISA